MSHTLKLTITAVGEPDSIFLTPCEPVTLHQSEVEAEPLAEAPVVERLDDVPKVQDEDQTVESLGDLDEPGFYVLEDGPAED